MSQVDPSHHRLLLEVFDENRLVSYLLMFNLSMYNLDYIANVLLWLLVFTFKYIFMFIERLKEEV